MNVKIFSNRHEIAYIPYKILPVFRLHCEEMGFHTRWDQKKKILDVNPGLYGKKIMFELNDHGRKKMGDTKNIFSMINSFLADSGAEVFEWKDPSSPFNPGHLNFQLLTVHDEADQLLISITNCDDRSEDLIEDIKKGLKESGIKFTSAMTEVRCQLPKEIEELDENLFDEHIALILSTSILRHFQGVQKASALSFLPIGSPNIFNQRNPILKDEKSDKSEMVEQVNTDSAKLVQAEAFFDYTVHVTGKESRPFLIIGNLFIKNTGTADLYSPVLCLRATPPESIKLQGQIVPPNMLKSVGVQAANGQKGWTYLEENWMEKGRETGEQWIQHIQPTHIPPNSLETLGFQLTILKSDEVKTIKFEGFIYFQEQNLNLPVNNRITISL